MEVTFLEGVMSEELNINLNDGNDQVLIVDDYPDNLTFVGELLSSNNITVHFAENGEEALKKAADIIPDLILLDISMPVMNGYDVCKKLKEDYNLRHIPVIFLTAKVESDDIIKGFEAGGSDYITKPFNLMELLSRVRAHLNLKNKHDKLQVMNSKLIDAVQKRSTELVKANEHLSKLDKAKNDFLIHINHQLRTPLNGIMGYSELLAQSSLNNEQTEFVREIGRLVKQLVKLSERSLLFTELRANNYKLNMQVVDALTSIEKAILVSTGRYGEKAVYINNEITSSEFTIFADEHLFYRCVTILLDNAIKFSSDGGVINITGEKKNGKAYIYIQDTGPGINDTIKTTLFEMFNSGVKNNEKIHGFGLGLATAKLIMDIQSAQIHVNNASEKGAIATLIFDDKVE